MKLAILSDIHANLTALEACHKRICEFSEKHVLVLLGDYVDYNPRPNETIALLKKIAPSYVIRGNHESAMVTDESMRFSSTRGVKSMEYTRLLLNEASKQFISEFSAPKISFIDENKKRILLVHGDLSDPLWGKMSNEEMQSDRYRDFDVVISGHTHIPHFREIFFELSVPTMRNKKKTIFLNPGSVGQPRNHCPLAQFLTFDTATEDVCFHKVPYDVKAEQQLFTGALDPFYSERLNQGI